jgi:uncharacterized protein
MKQIFTLFSGLLFGIGLALSGMTNPMKVLNFMDISGSFDATLIFVMGAALLTTLAGYTLVLKRKAPLFDSRFHLSVSKAIDTRLVVGAAMFGLGWGITGFCPGPAIASVVLGHTETLIFIAAMSAGILFERLLVAKPVASVS